MFGALVWEVRNRWAFRGPVKLGANRGSNDKRIASPPGSVLKSAPVPPLFV